MSDAIIGLAFLLFYIALVVAIIVGWCKMAQRLGYPALSGLLMLIPLVNVGVFLYWAFTESPNETKLRRLQIASARHRDETTSGFLSELQQGEDPPTDFLSDLEKS